nr:hypothetical protein [Tanacetum cinerariifolium]
MINIYNDSYEDYLEDFFATNHLSGNPTFSSHIDLTSPKVINPLSVNTTSSSPDHLLEEFANELTLITFLPGNDNLTFDIEFDLREIEYLLTHDPTKEMYSILEDSVDKGNLAYPNNNLVDTIHEMFTDEHTLDYSSPPLYDDVDDDLSDNDDVYDDPFDSKEDKIKESKLLIDELNPPRSSDFLPSPEYDSVLYEDFSKVDALPSTNNEEKVFNSGILIYENLFEVTIRVTPDNNVNKIYISNASLILKDLILLFMNFLSTKKFPGLKLYSRFHPKMRKEFSTPRFSLLKEFILFFSRNYLIRALKHSKSLKNFKARWRFFLANFVIVDYKSDPRVPLILGRPFLQTAHALIDVHGEKMILRDDDERLTLNMRHDTSSYSNQPHKESINMINIYNDSYEDYLEDFFATNHLSGNPTFSSHIDLTSPKVINPLSVNTTSSSPDHLLEEFANELTLITFLPGNDNLTFDIEFDLREIEYLLTHDPTKEMYSILEDSVDKGNLAYPNNNLVDTIHEMFTDEHTLDYSSPPLYDDVDDDLVKLVSDNDDVYDDPFDSKEDKIKEYKLLIDELDPSRSSDFLLSPEYDLVLYEDFLRLMLCLQPITRTK